MKLTSNSGIGLVLLTHFKFLAGMNTGERRRVQLGACWYELEGSSAKRLRLSTVGDFEGNESLVIRLLHDQKQELEFWFDDKLQDFRCKRGLYLFAGPVGSGKTSLMFDLAHRHFSNAQVITIEEPVELIESDFIQLQVNDVIGNSYDELIKLSLRHRPDLLIVGEIRDQQTARAVLRASLTGYTVFSTNFDKAKKLITSPKWKPLFKRFPISCINFACLINANFFPFGLNSRKMSVCI